MPTCLSHFGLYSPVKRFDKSSKPHCSYYILFVSLAAPSSGNKPFTILFLPDWQGSERCLCRLKFKISPQFGAPSGTRTYNCMIRSRLILCLPGRTGSTEGAGVYIWRSRCLLGHTEICESHLVIAWKNERRPGWSIQYSDLRSMAHLVLLGWMVTHTRSKLRIIIVALRLARYFGTLERFWLNLQSRYDLELQKMELGDRLEKEVKALD
jgi:hypothetical protein